MSRYSAPRILGMHIHSTPATLHGIVRLAEQHVQLPDALMQSTALRIHYALARVAVRTHMLAQPTDTHAQLI